MVTVVTTFRLYKPNLYSIFDPGLGMICLIPSKCWAEVDKVVKMFVVFFFNQV